MGKEGEEGRGGGDKLIRISIYLNLIDELINQFSPGVKKHTHRYKYTFFKIQMGLICVDARFFDPWG